MKKQFKIMVFITMMVTICISSKRIANYLMDSYAQGISYLAQATTETKNFLMYQ